MPPPMIRVMPGAALAPPWGVAAARGARAPTGAGDDTPGARCDACRKITRTSSSTERPLRAARSRSSALMASSSLRMVRLAMVRIQICQQCYHNMIALQSNREPPHRKQDGNEGDGDDPQRDGAPAVLAPFGAAERRDRLRR